MVRQRWQWRRRRWWRWWGVKRTERVHDHLSDAGDGLVALNLRHLEVTVAGTGERLKVANHGHLAIGKTGG